MIAKILTINNFAVFDRFEWDKCLQKDKNPNITFGKINIIYGRNYSGKTTLSRIISSLELQELPEKYDNPQFSILLADNRTIDQDSIKSISLTVRVFNEDFVQKNLSFLSDPSSSIEPFAIIGANNIEIESKIQLLQEEIGNDITSNLTGLYKQLDDAKKISEEVYKIYNKEEKNLIDQLSKKATDPKTGIKYNFDKFGNQNYDLKSIKKDLSTVNSSDYLCLTSKEKNELENIINEQNKASISLLKTPKLQLNFFCEQSLNLMNRKIGSSNKITELIHQSALNDWVAKGVSLLEGKDVCAFCGNPIAKERWDIIHAHFDEDSKNLEKEIVDLISQINFDIDLLQNGFNFDKTMFYFHFYDRIDLLINNINKEITNYCCSLKKIIEQLDNKRRNITLSLLFNKPTDNSANYIKLIEDFNDIINENNNYSNNLQSKIKNAQNKLLLDEIYSFSDAIDYNRQIKNLESLKNSYTDKSKSFEHIQNILNQKLQDLQSTIRLLNDEEEGAKLVNNYLNIYFEHNFISLETIKPNESDKSVKFRIMRNGNTAFNLSLGERSLISFCYFIAKLDDIKTAGKKPIIWIDDPISSLDSNHVFFLYTLLKTKIIEEKKYEQLFISTHNLNFLKYLTSLSKSKEKNNSKFFILQRQDKISNIQVMPNYLQSFVTEFNYLFHQIYICSQIEIVTDANYTSFYNFGNNTRKFLEILLFYYYPDCTKYIDKLEKFFGNQRIPAVLTDRIYNEYSHLCGVFERGELPTEVPEMLTTAKLIIETIKTKNPDQYASLLNSIGITT